MNTVELKRNVPHRSVPTLPRTDEAIEGFAHVSSCAGHYERAAKDEYYGTDESSLVERLGHPIAIVRGSERNIKITRPGDLTLARAFLEEETAK